MEIGMYRCDCGCESVCVTRVVLRCGDDGRAEHRIEVADGTRRGHLDWRVTRIVVVAEFHFGRPEVLRTEVACARCGSPIPDAIGRELIAQAGDVDEVTESQIVPVSDPSTVPRNPSRAVA